MEQRMKNLVAVTSWTYFKRERERERGIGIEVMDGLDLDWFKDVREGWKREVYMEIADSHEKKMTWKWSNWLKWRNLYNKEAWDWDVWI